MDNDAFRRTYREINERYCAYEKGILTNHCGCSQAKKFCIAEREGVHCTSDEAQQTCIVLLDLLGQQARFALKAHSPGSALPHTKAMRLQVGGLRGIAAALDPDAPVPDYVQDVHATLLAAIARFGGLQNLPFSRVIREIAAYAPRRRRRRP
ncbi:MAG: hypothetical protein LJE61_07095 [Thiocapsa sp.]|nr:hypothetical protein [Thiocapsa sp.]MCG6897061.1 hypothetical protein [Thiocapsa sp.]MCG6984949.1 hypothetical protein [Thiocapsa sp.]